MKAAVKLALTVAAACLLPMAGHAQSVEAEPEETVEQAKPEVQVLGVVEAFMAGLAAKDADAMSAFALDSAYLAFVRPGEEGDEARTMTLARAITSLAETEPAISEPIRDPVVMVDGPVAMVWAPYDFYVEGVRNHCGVNVFSLLRQGEDWRIASVVYSYVPDDCPEADDAENAE